MEWDPEASASLKRAPALLRRMVKQRVENFARDRGAPRVTMELVEQARRRLRHASVPAAELERLKHETLRAEEQRRSSDAYRIQVCGGAVGCPRALMPVAEMADRLAETLRRSGWAEHLSSRSSGPLLAHQQIRVAVAGCPNSCSQPQIADFGAVGQASPQTREGLCNHCGACVRACQEEAITLEASGPVIDRSRCLKCGDCIAACEVGALYTGQTGWRLMAGGKLGRHPKLAQEVAAMAADQQAEQALAAAIGLMICQARPEERLGALLERTGLGPLEQAAGKR